MKRIAILDNTFYVRYRIRDLVHELNAELIEATTEQQMMNLLHTQEEIDLVLLEIRLPDEDGFKVLQNIRAIRGDVPVIILTSENKRTSFIRGIQEGASDYVLKPFDDTFLMSRIKEHLNRKRTTTKFQAKEVGHKSLSVDFQNYLDKELKKALKGNYDVTLMITFFYKSVVEVTPRIEKEYNKVSEIIFPYFQRIIFETDLFMPYGSQSFIGIFPFCSKENQHFIDDKFQETFEDLQMDNVLLNNYQMFNTYVTFPYDGERRKTLMEVLSDRIFEHVENNHIMLARDEFKSIE